MGTCRTRCRPPRTDMRSPTTRNRVKEPAENTGRAYHVPMAVLQHVGFGSVRPRTYAARCLVLAHARGTTRRAPLRGAAWRLLTGGSPGHSLART